MGHPDQQIPVGIPVTGYSGQIEYPRINDSRLTGLYSNDTSLMNS